MKLVVTSNITKVSARYRRMARNLPGIVDEALRDLVDSEALPLFENTVSTWVYRPTFESIKTARGWAVSADPIVPYGWVDQGTRPHPITAKNAPLLRFTGPYHAKTKVNVISSFQGGRGKVWVSKRTVQHPGIQARNFTSIIMRRMQSRAANRVRKALNHASYGAGQGL